MIKHYSGQQGDFWTLEAWFLDENEGTGQKHNTYFTKEYSSCTAQVAGKV